MKPPLKLLLCHHGTAGARAAENVAHELAVPGTTTVIHCLVVPELWAGMQGDDCLAYEAVMRLGEPADVVLAVAAESGTDLVVIGPPRRKGEEGLRSRMDLEKLARGLKCPLLIAPRP